MRMKAQYLFVGAVAGAAALYFVAGALFGGRTPPPAQAKPTGSEAPSVQVIDGPQAIREREVVLRGRTEAARTVVVRSETAGVVAATPAQEGAVVAKGAVLCRLAVDARRATLDQARAALRSAQLQHQAAV